MAPLQLEDRQMMEAGVLLASMFIIAGLCSLYSGVPPQMGPAVADLFMQNLPGM